MEKELLALTNSFRRSKGLRPLKLDLKLSRSAYLHASSMATNDYFSHIGIDGSSVRTRTRAAGYRGFLIGENIAAGYSTAANTFNALLASPAHRKNMLHPLYRDIGIGLYYLAYDTGNVNYSYYWVQDFGKKLG